MGKIVDVVFLGILLEKGKQTGGPPPCKKSHELEQEGIGGYSPDHISPKVGSSHRSGTWSLEGREFYGAICTSWQNL